MRRRVPARPVSHFKERYCMSKVVKVDEDYLKQLIAFLSRKTMGKILKKADIIGTPELLKQVIKESIYEEFRELLYALQNYEAGARIKVIEIKDRD